MSWTQLFLYRRHEGAAQCRQTIASIKVGNALTLLILIFHRFTRELSDRELWIHGMDWPAAARPPRPLVPELACPVQQTLALAGTLGLCLLCLAVAAGTHIHAAAAALGTRLRSLLAGR